MKAHDQVLKTLLDLDDHQGVFFNLKSILENAHPDLTRDEINDILDQLRAKKLISTSARKIKNELAFIKVNSSAYTYYKQREAREAAEAIEITEAATNALEEIEVREQRSWNYKLVLLGYAAGLASGIAFMWAR